MGWAETTVLSLIENDIRVVTYVPDNVLIPLISGFKADERLTVFSATREEEAIGIACGAYLGGSRALVMMQSSGFGNIPNALASLATPYQIPVLMIISERGSLGEYNSVQVPITRVIRPTLDALGIPHFTLNREDEVEFVVPRMAAQCFNTQTPAAIILSPMLTGGKLDR
ncbi:MAG: thiamine pyrophosphate-binding protein [Nitrolancea sp.]